MSQKLETKSVKKNLKMLLSYDCPQCLSAKVREDSPTYPCCSLKCEAKYREYVEIQQVRAGCMVQLQGSAVTMVLVSKTMGSALVSVSKKGKCFHKEVDYQALQHISLATMVKVIKPVDKNFDADSYITASVRNKRNLEKDRVLPVNRIGEIEMPKAKQAKTKDAQPSPVKPEKPAKTAKPVDEAKALAKDADITAKALAKKLIKANELTYVQIHAQLVDQVPNFTRSASWVSNIAYYMRQDGEIPKAS